MLWSMRFNPWAMGYWKAYILAIGLQLMPLLVCLCKFIYQEAWNFTAGRIKRCVTSVIRSNPKGSVSKSGGVSPWARHTPKRHNKGILRTYRRTQVQSKSEWILAGSINRIATGAKLSLITHSRDHIFIWNLRPPQSLQLEVWNLANDRGGYSICIDHVYT